MKNANSVFVATITDVKETKVCPAKGPQWCSMLCLHETTVEGVWKGTPGKTVKLDTGSGAGDCSRGGNLGKGKRWLIFARTYHHAPRSPRRRSKVIRPGFESGTGCHALDHFNRD
jgi:hypothetical protein